MVILIMLACQPSMAKAFEIAIVKSNHSKPFDIFIEGFRHALPSSELHIKSINNDEALGRSILNKLSENPKIDIILTLGSKASWLARNISNKPVLFSMLSNPGRYQLNNTPGVLINVPYQDYLKQNKTLLPRVQNIGVLYSAQQQKLLEEIKQYASDKGLHLNGYQIDGLKDIAHATDTLLRHNDALWLISDPVVTRSPRIIKDIIILKAVQQHIPIIGLNKWSVVNGALYCLSTDYTSLGTQSAKMVQRILAGEKRIGHEAGKDIKVFVNNHIYETLSTTTKITLPTRSYLLR